MDHEKDIDELAASFLQQKIAAGQAAGKTQAEIEQALSSASVSLLVQMLGLPFPQGPRLLTELQTLLAVSEAEARAMCQEFIAAGLLDDQLHLTPKGQLFTGGLDPA
jgi:hypothetical protein